MNKNRREFFRRALMGSGALASAKAWAAQGQPDHSARATNHSGANPGQETQKDSPSGGLLPVQTPDLPKLPCEIENGVKVFHLVAEPVKREFLPGKVVDVWGYNGSMPGPAMEITEGDRVRIIVDNHLPEPTSMHWHGFEIPIEMDGMPVISQPVIEPGGRYVYEFTLHQHGTFFYHTHMAMQEMMGLIGLFIMHPKEAYRPRVDKDFGIILQEWAVLPNNTVPNTLSMEFNWLTMNGKASPATTPLIVRLGERVRIRIVNMGMDHHPIHLHGHTFHVTGTEAGRIPESSWIPGNTALVGVAQARDIEFEANYAGDWMLHCHMPHHMMNQMASMVGPLSHAGHGMHAGMGMEEGMGMPVSHDHALAEELGPSFGRAMGVGSEFERPKTNLPLQQDAGSEHAEHSQHAGHDTHESGNPWLVPGYPQDHFHPMDEAVAKPETFGLPAGWSGHMMGMMTLVRALPPEVYDKVMALREHPDQLPKNPPAMEEHHHG